MAARGWWCKESLSALAGAHPEHYVNNDYESDDERREHGESRTSAMADP